MRTLLIAATILIAQSAFSATQAVFIYGNSRAEVQNKVNDFLSRLSGRGYVRQLHRSECNPSHSERRRNKRLERRAYSISYRSGDGDYVVDRNGNFRPVRPYAIVKVSCR